MKVTTLGNHNAFCVGDYVDAITLEDVEETLGLLKRPDNDGIPIPDLPTDTFSAKDLLKALKGKAKSLYDARWQSNFMLEFDSPGKKGNDKTRFVIDFGGDLRHALKRFGLGMADIDAFYCSHPHNDHCGGGEGIALSTFFHPFWNKQKGDWVNGGNISHILCEETHSRDVACPPPEVKPDMYGHHSVLKELWETLAAGLRTLQGVKKVGLETYFNVIPMIDNEPIYFKDGKRTWEVYTVISVHVQSGNGMMPSYGLMFECDDGQIVYFPTDTQWMTPPQIRLHYNRADVVYQDCETGIHSMVHAHIDKLKTCDAELKEKMYLYHFADYPEVELGEFKGVLRAGDVHEY